MNVVDEIGRQLDRRHYAGIVFLNLQKAFDTVDHKKLLTALDEMGTWGNANGIIKNYLCNR